MAPAAGLKTSSSADRRGCGTAASGGRSVIDHPAIVLGSRQINYVARRDIIIYHNPRTLRGRNRVDCKNVLRTLKCSHIVTAFEQFAQPRRCPMRGTPQ